MKRRILSIITALALCLSLCPTWALAAEADPALCPHHREHTEECGYIAPSEGQPCGHEHTDECYTLGALPDTDSGDYYEIGADTENLLDCQHTHDSECGYVQANPGQSCGYECRICPIEDLIAALPDTVMEDNADNVRAQLDHILDLYRELDEDEQGQIDLSRCYALQAALDGANDPMPAAESVDCREASWNGSEVIYTDRTETCTSVENSTEAVTWNAGWYAVSGNVTISEPITVNGEVHLILTDGCDLTAAKGIVVTSTNSLTIYAQSGGTGTLNATGTTDSSNNASAGIGGSTSSFDSGSITIHGGVINATSGASRWYSGAGIGGSTPSSGNGGNSGAIKIYGGTITAESTGYTTGAGIGGGGSGGTGDGGAGTNIIIYGGSITATSHSTGNGGAGIGGGSGQQNGGTGDAIAIHGGVVRATGGSLGAGIGGGGGSKKSGDGTVTISGGTVTAVGGSNAAGIGGGGGYSGDYGMNITGGTGSVTITGGIVDATENGGGASIGNGGNTTATATVNKTTGIVFENGAGTVCGAVTFDGSYTVPAGYTLNIPAGASLSGSGTLSGGGAFTTENLTEDMISVPTDFYYNGEDRTTELTEAVAINGGVTICGQTFTVRGWSVTVSKTDDLHYTATYTNESDNTKNFTKTITLQQSGTQFVEDGAVKTYKDGVVCSDFTASDTITVKATPTPTGAAPTNSAMFAASFTAPGAGQMAVFVNDIQVSEPVNAVDGSYTMTVSAADVLLAAGGPGTGITLTAKFIGNDNMADGAGTATVNITAVAKAELDGKVIGYYGESNLADAFDDSGNADATFTLLANVERTTILTIKVNCILDLNGKTIHSTGQYESALGISSGATVTIRGDGTVTSEHGNGLSVGGTATLEGGNFISGAADYGGVNVSGKLIVTGENVVMRNTGNGNGLSVNSGTGATAQLSAGTYGGGTAAIEIYQSTSTLAGLLNQEGASRVAFYKDNTTLVTEGLDGKTLPSGSYTVKACTHTGEGVCTYTHNENTSTHTKTCLACGYAGAAESCAYSDDYGHDETNHWQTCTLCGGKKTEAHGWVHQCTSATGIIRRSCDKCEIETVVGTVSITPDFSVTYGKTGSATLVCTAELADGYSLEPADSADNCWVLMALSDGKSWNLGRELEVKLPADLPAGEYWYNASPRLSYQGNNTIVKRFNVIGKVTVTPAPLTVTGAAAKDRTYDGTNSVQITGVTLDGVLNSDNVSVDLTGLTGTLSGSDAETYTSVTLPRLTLTGGAASNYTLPQSMGAVPASVTISKATLTATGATVASKTYDGNTAASVSSVTFTGLVPGEALALGQDYTAFGNYDDPNAGENKSATILVELKSSAKANNYTLPKDSSVNATGTITKASSSITTAPSATGITYGQALSDSTLTGGTGSVPGAFAWTDSTAKPNAGTAQFEVTFTPTDTNYNSTTTNVSVTVAKATPTLTAPTATAIQYGQKLTDSALTGGTATNPNGSAAIAGSWHWASGNTQPTATGTFPVSFAPSDTANYNTPANVDTSVTVNPAAPKITLTVPAYQVAGEDVIVTCTVENPHDATFKEGIPENITLTYQIGSGTPQTITNGKFSIPAGTKKDTVITVTASTDAVNGKYTAATKTATVTVTDKIPVEISGISVTGRVYNGQPVNYTGTPVVKKLDGTVVTDALVSYTWSSVTAPVNAGDYSLVVAVGGGKYIGSTTIPVVIEQAEIRVTAPSKTIYVGETAPVFSAADCNITGLVQGENLKTPPTVAYAEAPDTSKTGSVTVTASGAEVPEGGNYKDRIVYENGTLTITSKPLPPAKYTITVQAGTGGTASASPTSAEKGTKITLNATPDGGYHFKEWQVISGDVTISNNSFTMPAANVTVKAMFEKDGGTTPPQPAEYSVTFDGNGGTSPAAQTTTGGKLTNLPTSTQSGYSFNGWYTAKTGGDKITLDTIFTASVTVYAHWTKDSSGGSSGDGNGNSGGSSSGGSSSSGGGSSSGDNGSSDGSTIVARPDETKPDTPTTSQTKPAAPGHKVKKPSVPEVRSFRAKPGKKKLAFSWKKVPGAAGFQIQISTKKGFKGAKTISVSKSNKTYTKKGLKTKKKYYIRIRAYKTYLDKNKKTKKVYGKWIRISKKTR